MSFNCMYRNRLSFSKRICMKNYKRPMIRNSFVKYLNILNISTIPIVAEKISLKQVENASFDKLPIEFVPNDLELFKKLLLEKKKAYVDWYYQNG